MKRISYLLILLLSLQFIGCSEGGVPKKILSDVDSIASRWVPQNSESLCDAELVFSSSGRIIVRGETNLAEAKEEISEYMKNSGHAFTDSLTLLPDTSIIKKPWGLITLSVSNIRSKPSHSAEMITQAILGTPVKILKKDGGWMFIQTPDSYLGWTNNSAVAEFSEAEMAEWRKADRVIFKRNYGDILSSKGEVVSDLVFGAIIAKTGEAKANFNIELPDGREGYIKMSEASDFRTWAENTHPAADDLTAYARTLLGSPYLWGGTSSKGIDCSGYVKTIYFSNGVILTRDASSQYKYGKEIPVENNLDSLLPGDLLFFGRERDGRKIITHVGMYIGDTEVIHSPGIIEVMSLDSTRVNYSNYRSRSLQGAKRIIGVTPGKGIERVSQHNWYF